jgi:hypothetical protein
MMRIAVILMTLRWLAGGAIVCENDARQRDSCSQNGGNTRRDSPDNSS